MAVPAIGRPSLLIELASVRIRVTVGAMRAETRPLEQIVSVELSAAVALPTRGLEVGVFEKKARHAMIELDLRPACGGMTTLAATARHEPIQTSTMRIIVAVLARR